MGGDRQVNTHGRGADFGEEKGGNIIVRRAGRFSSADIQRALFGDKTPQSRTIAELKEGIRSYIRNHKDLVLQGPEAIASSLELFRASPAPGFSDCLSV
jgi:hypothetical protein